MGIIFGRRGCSEDRDWRIVVFGIDGNEAKVTDQMAFGEAEKIYKEIKEKLQNKLPYIEVEYRGDTFLFMKHNIDTIKLELN